MMRSRILLLAAATVLLVGCGSSDGGSSKGDSGGSSDAAGRKLFASTCGSCHTLDDAGTNGTMGPALDGMGLDEERVAQQIESGGGGMPAGLLTGKDRDAVAAYVANHAG